MPLTRGHMRALYPLLCGLLRSNACLTPQADQDAEDIVLPETSAGQSRGQVHFMSDLKGATVLVDGQVMGTVPCIWESGTPGQDYSVEYQYAGASPVAFQVTFPAAGDAVVCSRSFDPRDVVQVGPPLCAARAGAARPPMVAARRPLLSPIVLHPPPPPGPAPLVLTQAWPNTATPCFRTLGSFLEHNPPLPRAKMPQATRHWPSRNPPPPQGGLQPTVSQGGGGGSWRPNPRSRTPRVLEPSFSRFQSSVEGGLHLRAGRREGHYGWHSVGVAVMPCALVLWGGCRPVALDCHVLRGGFG